MLRTAPFSHCVLLPYLHRGFSPKIKQDDLDFIMNQIDESKRGELTFEEVAA